MVMTRSQTAAAAAASASVAAVHAAAQAPPSGGNKRRVRMTWTEEEDWVAKILLELAGQKTQQRPRRTCAKY